MFDTHTHLHEADFNDTREEIIQELHARDIRGILVGTDAQTSEAAMDLARQEPELFWSTAGIHPHEAGEDWSSDMDRIKTLASQESPVGIGECGLDRGRPLSQEETRAQKDLFERQIELAADRRLPLVIHTREAWQDTYEMLKNVRDHPIILHCFTGDAFWAKTFLSEFPNLMISFSGIVTFRKKVEDIRKAAHVVPVDKTLAETDSPYLAPEPYRGTRNDTRNIGRVIQVLAELNAMPFESMETILDANARLIFGLPHPGS